MRDLLALQRHFQALVIAGEGDLAGLVAGGDLGIYAHAYRERLHDALAADHPKLRAGLGTDEFAALVGRYLRACPPRSYTLRDAGDRLAAYLAGDALVPSWAADLARLERARVEVFDGPDSTPLDRDTVAGADPALLPSLLLRWIPAARVIELASAVDDTWSAIEDEQAFEPPIAARKAVLVWRRELAVFHRTLDADEAAVAGALVAGATFAEVCASLAELVDGDPAERAVELLLRWIDAAVLLAPSQAEP